MGPTDTGGENQIGEYADARSYRNQEPQPASRATCREWHDRERLAETRVADDYGSCYQEDLIVPYATDGSTPPPGQIHWYLVTGEHFVGEGSLGETSSLVERPNTGACP